MNLRGVVQTQLERWVRRSFPLWQRLGIHVVPNNFYHPIPDTRRLRDELWQRPSELPGIDMRPAAQRELVAELARRFGDEWARFPRQPTATPTQYHLDNGFFGPVDGEMLYGMIRWLRPARVFEIGSGFSTLAAAEAVRANARDGHPCELVAFEPYPNATLRAGVPGLARLEPIVAQDIPLARFAELGENDVLFIDSSHIVKTGSDVNYLFLEVLPRLRPGVVVHVHDIFLPREYPKAWVKESYTFFNEQYLLQAFLMFNSTFEVLFTGSYLHATQPDVLAAAFASYAPSSGGPGSFWMRRTR
jgi:predicted O-methyltransferase YrrM